jgi:hypothetical protein
MNLASTSPYLSDPDLIETDLQRLAIEKFGDPATVPEELKKADLLLSHLMIRKTLASPDVMESLAELGSTLEHAPSEVPQALAELGATRPGLVMLFEIAKEPNPEMEARFARELLLTDEEAAKFSEVVRVCGELVPLVGDHLDRLENEEALAELVGSVDLAALEEFVTHFHASGRWLKPLEALLPVAKLEATAAASPMGFLQPQIWAEIFLNVDHYRAAAARFDALHQPHLADTARLFLAYATALRGAVQEGKRETLSFSDTRALLDRIDKYPAERLSVFDELGELVLAVRGFVRVLTSMDATASVEVRRLDLEKAEKHLYECRGMPPLRWLSPSLRWMRAQLLKGNRREEVELEAYALVNELAAETARHTDVMARLCGMATLSMLPASWKLAKGDYRGAVESATTAKSFAAASIGEMQAHSTAFGAEIDKELDQMAQDDPTAAQLKGLRDFVVTMARNARLLVDACEILIVTSKARLVERQGDYAKASQYYEEAAQIEEAAREAVRSFFANAVGALPRASSGSSKARAAYYSAMAEINRGDQRFIENSLSEAKDYYGAAKELLDAAIQSWKAELEADESRSAQQLDALREEQNVCVLRARYCDAKIDIVDAEHYTASGRAWDATVKLERVTRIFRELRTSLSLAAGAKAETNARDSKLLWACEEYSRARYLMELDRDSSRNDNYVAVLESLNTAQSRFDDCQETHWSGYIATLRKRYETSVAAHASLTIPRLAFPKPSDPVPAAAGSSQQTLEQLKFAGAPTVNRISPDVELRQLQARAIALGESMVELNELHVRGRIDTERYTNLRTEQNAKRIIVLMEMQHVYGAHDPELKSLLQQAINGEDENALRPLLAGLAETRGLDAGQIDSIRQAGQPLLGYFARVSSGIVQNIIFQAGAHGVVGGKDMKYEEGNVTVSNSTLIQSPVALKQELIESYSQQLERAQSPDLKKLLDTLLEQSAKLLSELPAKKAELAKEDLDGLVKQASADTPRRGHFDVSAKGLVEAATAVKDMAPAIAATVATICKTIFG